MKTMKIITKTKSMSIEAADISVTKDFAGVKAWELQRPVKLDGKELLTGTDINFGENVDIEYDGKTFHGAVELFVNGDSSVIKCLNPDEDPLVCMNSPNAFGAAYDLNNISGSVGPFTYNVNVHLDTDQMTNSYFVVELKAFSIKLVDVHLDANHPKVTFGGSVAGIGASGTLGVDFNECRIYVEAEVKYLFDSKKFSFDLYHWKNYCVQRTSNGGAVQALRGSNSGWISIENEGWYVAKFDVTYTLNGERVTKESGEFTAGVTKVIDIPAGAVDIVLHAWNAYFIKSWREIFSKSFDEPVAKKYKVTGTSLNTDYKEL